MHSDRIRQALADILHAIGLIEAWVGEAGGVEKAIAPDTQTRNAIERQLLIISEAAIRLHRHDPEVAGRLAPSVDWAGVRGMGNFIRHKYDDLDPEIIADVLRTKLSELRTACVAARKTLSPDH